MISFTNQAKEQVLAVIRQQQGKKPALRILATANGTAEFQYSMQLIMADEQSPEDLVIDAGEFPVILDPRSAENLNGATVDFEDKILRSGFKFRNPNKPTVPSLGEGPRADLTGPVVERVQRLLDTEINPAIAAHGGEVHLLGVRKNKVYVSFGGGCHGCGMVDVTLKQGIETRIKEAVPGIVEVVDTTDHTTGENPFYS